MEPVFSGFGSPVASPGGFMPVQTPDDKTKTNGCVNVARGAAPCACNGFRRFLQHPNKQRRCAHPEALHQVLRQP